MLINSDNELWVIRDGMIFLHVQETSGFYQQAGREEKLFRLPASLFLR
jgi:hypothetical protein